jgi:hypothetical protein
MILESIERKSPVIDIDNNRTITLNGGTTSTWIGTSPYITTTAASPTIINPTYVTSATTDNAVYIDGERLNGLHSIQFTTSTPNNTTLSSGTAYVNNQSLGVMVSGPHK